MTAVLKNVVATRLMRKPGSRPAPDPRPLIDPRIDALESALTASEAALAIARDTAAEDARRACVDRDTAHRRGLDEGRKLAEDDAAERSAVLADAVAKAQAAWRARLDDLEPLAATLARTALARMFASADLDTLVIATIARHADALRAAGVVALHVQPALADRVNDRTLDVVADPTLPDGGCRVALALGEADISVIRQWQAVDALLATLEAPR